MFGDCSGTRVFRMKEQSSNICCLYTTLIIYCRHIANCLLRDQICNTKASTYTAWIQIAKEQKQLGWHSGEGFVGISTDIGIHTHVSKFLNLSTHSLPFPFHRHLSYFLSINPLPLCKSFETAADGNVHRRSYARENFVSDFTMKQQKVLVSFWLVCGRRVYRFLLILEMSAHIMRMGE
jgi:hypothetical protein